MGRITQMPRIDVDVNLKLTMVEVQALDALAGYGIKSFLEVFYQHMGKHYLQPHEQGLRSLFETIRGELPPIIKRHENARRAFALADPRVLNRKDYDDAIARAIEIGRAQEADAALQRAAAQKDTP